ncbi:MAG: glycosyltransferase family 4 protein [Anaerolineaceae bacterium]|nr:glycosyltransferase family 4 protein [Anaerolineaceae bacterium]
MKSLKLLITVGIFPPDIGGPATYVPFIAEALASRGHRVTVVAPQNANESSSIGSVGYRLVRFNRPAVLRYANYLIEQFQALVTIFQEAKSSDLIYVNGLDFPAAIVGWLLRKPLVTKVVGDGAWELAYSRGWTQLSLDEFQSFRSFRVTLFRFLRHYSARKSVAVITPSRYLKDVVTQWGVAAARIRTIYNAFFQEDGSELGVDIPEQLWSGLRVITVGRIIAHKRIHQIIAAVSSVPNAKLVVVGDGPLRPILEEQVKTLEVANRVHFTGKISKAQVDYLLAHYAQLFVLNSTYEGLPHVVLEAAYHHVPVVATAAGGTVEVIAHEKSGLLVRPERPSEILLALLRLQRNPDLGKKLAEAAHKSLVNFSVDRMVDETEQVLSDAIK